MDLNNVVHKDLHPMLTGTDYKEELGRLEIERAGPTVEMSSDLLLDHGMLVDVEHSVPYEADGGASHEKARSKGTIRRRPKRVTKWRRMVIPALYEVASNTSGTTEGITELPLMGESFTGDSICLDAGLHHGNMSHKIISLEEGRHSIIVLTRPYKNNTPMIREVIRTAKIMGEHLVRVSNLPSHQEVDTAAARAHASMQVLCGGQLHACWETL